MTIDMDKVLHAFEPDADAAAFAELRQHRSGPGTEFDVELCGMERRVATLRARIRELEARVTGGLAGEPRQAYRGEGAAASDEQPRPASPPTSAVGDLLANVIRKMTLHDWHLRLTQEEANALKQWVLERNGENKPRRRPRRRG